MGRERGGCRRCSSGLQYHQTSLPKLDHDSALVGVAACRVISLHPAETERRRRQSERHPDDATFDCSDLDGGPDDVRYRSERLVRDVHGERHDVAMHHLGRPGTRRALFLKNEFPELCSVSDDASLRGRAEDADDCV